MFAHDDFSHKAPPFSCGSIELEKFITGRVPAARFHGNQATNIRCSLRTRSAFGGDVALFIAYKLRHGDYNDSDIIIIKLTAFIQNVYFGFFVLGK